MLRNLNIDEWYDALLTSVKKRKDAWVKIPIDFIRTLLETVNSNKTNVETLETDLSANTLQTNANLVNITTLFNDRNDINTRTSDMTYANVSTTGNITTRWTTVDTSGGNVTVTLPNVTSVPEGIDYIITKTQAANTLTIDGNNAETINGALITELTDQWSSITLRSTNTEWIIV